MEEEKRKKIKRIILDSEEEEEEEEEEEHEEEAEQTNARKVVDLSADSSSAEEEEEEATAVSKRGGKKKKTEEEDDYSEEEEEEEEEEDADAEFQLSEEDEEDEMEEELDDESDEDYEASSSRTRRRLSTAKPRSKPSKGGRRSACTTPASRIDLANEAEEEEVSNTTSSHGGGGLTASSERLHSLGLRRRSKQINYAEINGEEEDESEEEDDDNASDAEEQESEEDEDFVDVNNRAASRTSRANASRKASQRKSSGNATRWSSRQKRNTSVNYAEESSESDSDDYVDSANDPTVPEEPAKKVIEKLLSHKALSKGASDPGNKPDSNQKDKEKLQQSQEDPTIIGEDEALADMLYLVKWKGLSYLHLTWVPEAEILKERFGKQKIVRYWQNPSSVYGEVDEEKPFNPDFVQVDRILDEEEELDEKGELVKKYFVKWESLPYADCTWELASDLNDDEKIEIFKRSQEPPANIAKLKPHPKPRPPPSHYKEYTESPVFKAGNQLRPYQLEGVNWLIWNWYQNQNSILADEMGLGKTVQSISTLWHLFDREKRRGPFLIIAPLSTIQHWKRECEGWTNMNCVIYHGTAESRQIIRQYEWHYTDKNKKPYKTCYKFNLLITTYEMVLTDKNILQAIDWDYIVIDEAHRLKNKNSKLLVDLRTFNFESVLLLTGTPLQNNTEELWSLLNFMEPEKFSSCEDFLAQFGDLKGSEQVTQLHEVLRPHLLRRMKENVEKSIAPKEETIVEVELTTIQKKYYKAIYEKNIAFLRKGCTGSNMPNMLNIVMQLRKCCNHPYLIKGVENQVTAGLPPHSNEVFEKLIQSSGKLVLIDKLLPKLQAGGHKVLIFSQMVRVLDILEDYLNYRSYKYERIDGGIRGNDRQAAIDRFSKEGSDRFVFLLCTRAGGVGINLTAADTVVIFDSDWNPQNDIQAQARCHRIGQTQMVKVYRLITRNTYERHMFERASKKLGLDQAILGKMGKKVNQESGETKEEKALDKRTIDSLLKYGAYNLRDDQNETQYDEEDIDKILERSSITVRSDQNSNENDQNNSALAMFSKASFCSADSARDINIDDPDFWKKVLPNSDVHYVDPLIQSGVRVRKRVKRFGATSLDGSSRKGFGEEEDEIASDDEAYSDDSSKKDKKCWSNAERTRFKSALFNFGFGRWQEIYDSAKLPRRTLEETELYGRALLHKISNFAIDEELRERGKNNRKPKQKKQKKEKKKEDSSESESDDSEDSDSQNSDEENKKSLSKEELRQRQAYREKREREIFLQVDNAPVPSSFSELSVRISNTPLPPIPDASSSSSSSSSSSPAASSSIENNNSTIDTTTKPEEQHTSLWSRFDDELSLTVSDFSEYLQRNAKKLIQLLSSISCLGRLVRSYQLSLDRIEAEVVLKLFPSNKPLKVVGTPSQWTSKEDAALLLGTYLHGMGRYDDVKNDAALPFFSKVKHTSKKEIEEEEEDKEEDEKEEETTFEWPLVKVLNSRLRRLMKAWEEERRKKQAQLKKRKQEDDKHKNGAENEDEKSDYFEDEDDDFVKPKLSKIWSKREKSDLNRALMSHGIPTRSKHDERRKTDEEDWDKLRRLARLNKTTTDVERYVRALLSLCNDTLRAQKKESSSSPKKKKKTKSKTSKERDENEDEEANARKAEERKATGVTEAVTPQFALRLTKRVALMENLRKVLSTTSASTNEEAEEELYERLKFCTTAVRSTKKNRMMPSWWRAGREHDLALLKAVLKHGFGRWDKICSDEEFPFRALAEQLRQEQEKTTEEEKNVKDEKEENKMMEETRDAMEVEDIERKEGEEKAEGDEENETRANESDFVTNQSVLGWPRESVITERLEYLINVLNSKMNKLIRPSSSSSSSTSSVSASVPFMMTKKRKVSALEENEQEGIKSPTTKVRLPPHRSKQQSIDAFVKKENGSRKRIRTAEKEGANGSEMYITEDGEGKESTKSIWDTIDGEEEEEEEEIEEFSEKNHEAEEADDGEDEDYDDDFVKQPTTKKGKQVVDLTKKSSKKSSPRPKTSKETTFPISIGAMKVYSLGEINESYHNKSYIWPVGYKSTRTYQSVLNPNDKCLYTSEILDPHSEDIKTLLTTLEEEAEEEQQTSSTSTAQKTKPGLTTKQIARMKGPLFVVTPEDDPQHPAIFDSATGAWSDILHRVNQRRSDSERRKFVNVSGPEYFGYSHPVIAKMIQQLPNADKCRKYQPKEERKKVNSNSNKETKETTTNGTVNGEKKEKKTKKEKKAKESRKRKRRESDLSTTTDASQKKGGKVQGKLNFVVTSSSSTPETKKRRTSENGNSTNSLLADFSFHKKKKKPEEEKEAEDERRKSRERSTSSSSASDREGKRTRDKEEEEEGSYRRGKENEDHDRHHHRHPHSRHDPHHRRSSSSSSSMSSRRSSSSSSSDDHHPHHHSHSHRRHPRQQHASK